MPDRLFDPGQHPRRVSYFMLILATLLTIALGALILQVVNNRDQDEHIAAQEQRIAALQSRLDTQDKTKFLACQQGKPGNTRFLKAMIQYFDDQQQTASQLLSRTPKDNSVYEPRRDSVRNYGRILHALKSFLPIRCGDA